MSIDLLIDLQQETRRLFIAGSGMAAGDLRLQRMLPQLQKLGETAPVFHRVAQSVHQLIEAETAGAPAKLLELGTLLHAVLYTQGKTETKEELLPIEGTDSSLSTRATYRKLFPVLEALTQKGQGRMEQLRQADEELLFQDFRVISAAVAALDDSYAEIPDFLFRKVLPDLGAAALTALRQQFKPDGGKGDSRRLTLLHALLPRFDGLSLLLNAAQAGSTEVRSTAIELLGYYPEQEMFILEQADDKKKEIRRAALLALSRLASEPAVARLYKALQSKDRDIAIEPIQLCQANPLTLDVIAYAEQAMTRILQRTGVEESAQQLLIAIRSLDGKRMPEVVHFLQKLLSETGCIVPETEAAQEAAAALLLQVNLPEADAFAMSLQQAHNRKWIAYSFQAAVRRLPPAEVYERFAHDVKDKKHGASKDLLRAFRNYFPHYDFLLYPESDAEETERQWDPRWVRLFMKMDEAELVCRLAEEPDGDIIAYLAAACRQHPNFSNGSTLRNMLALFRLRAKGAPELLMEILEGGKKQFYYLNHMQQVLLSLLPPSYAGRLEQFAGTVANGSVKEQLLRMAEEIAAKPEQTEFDEEKGQGLWGWIKSKMS
ncbi:HEAT repeat domain-containing protein [Paenibacillus ferrarius]|uniref:HEAT repeat domain-containing protein n=1 Tax=Paenibacillus ferrarius TaxID=1469647 RepID=UPI003D2D088C